MGASVLLISMVAGTMDVYWRRGVGFMGWACVGLAVVIIRLGNAGLLDGPGLTGTADSSRDGLVGTGAGREDPDHP